MIQIPISAGKAGGVRPKRIDIACTLCASEGKNRTFNQAYNYVMVIDDDTSKECNETGIQFDR